VSAAEPTNQFAVPPALAGERIDRAVATLVGWTRAEVATLCEAGSVLVGGRPVAKSRRLAEGEVVELLAEPAIAALPAPEADIEVVVRYEDPDVVVVAKPADLVVHPGAGQPDGTLVNGLLARYPEIATVGDPARPGIVHRLDRDTSGLMVVARTQVAYDALVTQLSERAVERRYLALVWGHPDASRGVIDAPIGRSTARRTRMAVRAGGREARTGYHVLETFADPATSLLDCRLETGRTHQIRVHLAAIDHPVVGDATYGGTRPSITLDRPFLHATELALTHPITGAEIRIVEPLPPDLEHLLTALR
jgi:23S rRNA pseudouridine1911/1915/1917 synthase